MLQRRIFGILHQGNSMFTFAGAQCTAIALFALSCIFLSTHNVTVYPNNWRTEDVDDIIVNGNSLYENLVYQEGMQPFTFISHSELPSRLSIYGYDLDIFVHYDMIYGSVDNFAPQNGFYVSLLDGLQTSFQVSDFVISTFNQMTVALFQSNNCFYIFDSHGRNSLDQLDSAGSAVLIEFTDLQSLCNYLFVNYFGSVFNLSPIIFQPNDDYLYRQPLNSFTPDNELNEKINCSSFNNDEKCMQNEGNNSFNKDTIEPNSKNNVDIVNITSNLQTIYDERSELVENYLLVEKKMKLENERRKQQIDKKLHFNVDLSENITIVRKRQLTHLISIDHCYGCDFSKRKRKKNRCSNNINKSERHDENKMEQEIIENSVCTHFFNDESCKMSDYEKSYIGNTSIARFATIYSSNTQGNNAETIFSLQNKLYRYKIEIPLFRCECCYAFLFNEQVKYIMIETNVTRKARVNVNDIVCNYCFGKLAKNELPCISVYGNKLHPGLIPECFIRMTLMEND